MPVGSGKRHMQQKPAVIYPFVPESAGQLVPGHFWALPLSDGTYGCGRVIQVPSKEVRRSSMHFLGAVLDWHAAEKPSSESIMAAPCLQQSHVHIRAITRTGGEILGFRDLALDGLRPWIFRGAAHHRNTQVKRGLIPVRLQTPEDEHLPVLQAAGFEALRLIAESRFVGNAMPEPSKLRRPAVAKNRGAGSPAALRDEPARPGNRTGPVPADPSQWSAQSQRSISACYTRAYGDIEYLCWHCRQAATFTAVDQRYTYEVRKAPIDQRRILCHACWKECLGIDQDIAACRQQWAASKQVLRTHAAFLERWLRLLIERESYAIHRSDTAAKNMLRKLLQALPGHTSERFPE